MKKNDSLKHNVIADKVRNYMNEGILAENYSDFKFLMDSLKQAWQGNEDETLADIVYRIIHDEIIEYYSSGICLADINNNEQAFTEIIESEREWNDLPCDEEGATPEQDEAIELFLNSVINRVSDNLINE